MQAYQSDEPAASAGSGRLRVLVLDPDEGVRRLLARILARRGAAIVEASETEEALRLAAKHKPSVALVDALVDEVLAGDFLPLLRRLAPGVRIGLLSAALPERGVHLADAVFPKPFQMEEMEGWILEGHL